MEKTDNAKQAAFRRKCERAAQTAGLDDVLFCDNEEATKDDEYEDDGVLHIRRHGLRAAFNVGDNQNLPGAVQNENTRAVMAALGMKRKVSERVLVEETEEEEEEPCPQCGHVD